MKIKKHSFTMVEVIISLGILTIAMFTLIGLLPAGLQNSEETEHATYAPIVADGFGTILTHLLNGDELALGGDGVDSWGTYWNTANIVEDKDKDGNDDNDNQKRLEYIDSIDEVSQNRGSSITKIGQFRAIDLSDTGDYMGRYKIGGSFDGISSNIKNDPFLKSFWLYGTGDSNFPDLFGGYYKGLSADGITQAEYGIRIWYGKVQVDTTSGTVAGALEPDAGDEDIIFTIEVSWPPQMEYQRRIAMGNFYKTTKVVNKK